MRLRMVTANLVRWTQCSPSDMTLPAPKADEKRREERIFTTLPVELRAATGVTRNVSATGMYFETDAAFSPGGELRFAVAFDTPGGRMRLNCQGSVLRVEAGAARVGVAVKITESTMELLANDNRRTHSNGPK